VKNQRVGTWNAVVIETSEGVRFSLPLAGPVSRFLAWLIDQAVIVGACGMISRVLRIFGSVSTDLTIGIAIVSYFAIWVGYGITLEWLWHGQTIGKRVLGLRVLDATGMKLRFSQIAVRNLMRFLDAMPFLYFVGGTAMLLSERYQRLGDSVADTIVLRQRLAAMPDLARVDRGEKYNSFLQIPHLAARLRQQASPELAYLAYQALLRRDELAVATRVEVFRSLADRFREMARFPDDITASLTDERYVRNALGVLMSRANPRQKNSDRSLAATAPFRATTARE
jgi:uncharacterized RDD family membrane protein YckC